MNIKYIWLLIILLGLTACNDIEDVSREEAKVILPELTAGSANFTTYVAVGASFTAGYTDNALFKASQENAYPNILSQQFAKIGGGIFTQPLMNDNFGGIALGGVQLPGFGPRLVFGGSGPVPLESVIGPVVSTTDLAVNNLTGPFNNMGVPGAKSFHLLFNGYGNPTNLATKTANPYFIRMASSESATVLGDAMLKSPTFFTLSEMGGNDVLGYAVSGGDDTNPITPSAGAVGVGFDATFNFLVTTLTSQGAKGVVTNVPYITDLPHFTTVPYNPLPLDASTATQLNNAYAQYNGGIQYALSQGDIDANEAAARTINFTASATNTMVLIDEDLTDLSGYSLPNYRQSTVHDLFVLPLSSLIPQGYGTQVPLADKWVLIPSEQAAIKDAIDAYNTTIAATADANPNIVLVDLNGILTQLASTGIPFDDYTMNAKLVTGGAIGLDGIHLTARGYAYLSNKFLEAIDTAFGSNFIASGNVAKAGNYPTNYAPNLN
ncbi:G-D-S-L family lipolytic protein [Mariniflexile litorale]|uniref:G-D-S-L family lipolytic protein n=1 Tax=Mariniflexile litorale TaxID=3045158 RepID=A0AAU7EH85_9FLAO|nr:G-D-S-L family lipolytic protein [Mariniflexile sp. KMM 9835]MDQ8211114.1 G-D-S-L family lipolytic protein [Mariniflexile sp. KMM 9835]